MARERELVDLLSVCTTAPAAIRAGILADWLEEYGSERDDRARQMLRAIQEQDYEWHVRRENVRWQPDYNLDRFTFWLHHREPVVAAGWNVYAFGIPPAAFGWTQGPAGAVIWALCLSDHWMPVESGPVAVVLGQTWASRGIPEMQVVRL